FGLLCRWPLSSIHNKAEPPAVAAAAATIAPWLSRGSRGALAVCRAGSRARPPAGLLQRSGFVYESGRGMRQAPGSEDPGRRGFATEAQGSGHREAAGRLTGPLRSHQPT
uniref:Uncharacterized protein n=1 Tax=Mustela putorius furo TaxID=9669 RepID=M3Y7R4_MUSPF